MCLCQQRSGDSGGLIGNCPRGDENNKEDFLFIFGRVSSQVKFISLPHLKTTSVDQSAAQAVHIVE